jgi:hypothetical protein
MAFIVVTAGLEANEFQEETIRKLSEANSKLRSENTRLRAQLGERAASGRRRKQGTDDAETVPAYSKAATEAVCKDSSIFHKCLSNVFKTTVLISKPDPSYYTKRRYVRVYRVKTDRGADFLLPSEAAFKPKHKQRDSFCYDVSCEIITAAIVDAPARNAPQSGKGTMVPKTSAAFNHVIDLKLEKTLRPTEHAAGKCPGGTTTGPCTTYGVTKKCELLYPDDEGIKLNEIVVAATSLGQPTPLKAAAKQSPAKMALVEADQKAKALVEADQKSKALVGAGTTTTRPDLQSNQGIKELCSLL